MASSRTRKRSLPAVSGTAKRFLDGNLLGEVNSSNFLRVQQTTSDIVGSPTTNNAFSSSKTERIVEGLTGRAPPDDPANYWTYEGLIPLVLQTAVPSMTLPASPITNNLAVSQFLAKSNPSRPEVDIAVTLGEFRELPKLVKIAGETLLKKGASAFLTYQFGWKPLIRDLHALLDFTEKVDQRVRELESLGRKGGLRRRITLETVNVQDNGSNITIESRLSRVFTARRTIYGHRSKWAVGRWKPINPGSYPKSSDAIRKLARQAAYGLHIDASSAWNLIPWSWLIDWYSNVGDMFASTRNTVRATVPGSITIMTMTRFTGVYDRNDSNVTIRGGKGLVILTDKFRVIGPSFVLPEAYFPLMSGRQLSILGALAVTRIPRSRLK